MQNDIKIQINNLCKSFGTNKVLNNIDLKIRNGKSLVILGGSGTGKSVLIKTIIGIIKPDSGTIKIDNQEIHTLNYSDRMKIIKKCGFLFQGGALFDSMNIQDNITFSIERDKLLTKNEKRDIAVQKLKQVGLNENVLKLYPSELSGGMQKRVALARAICTNPEIIFFDEPTTGLDPIMSNIINDLIVSISNELGATTITITHDINSAKLIANDVALIHKGQIILQGNNQDLHDPKDPFLNQFINGLIKGPMNYNI